VNEQYDTKFISNTSNGTVPAWVNASVQGGVLCNDD
jgi:hypothetical protein